MPSTRRILTAAHRVSVVVAACAIALTVAAPASAHAGLEATTPANGAVLDRAPRRVVLRFDEAVSAVTGGIRLYDDQARRIDDGVVSRPAPRTVALAVPAPLATGTYTVTWRVVSADSHPVHGAFVFSVGTATGAGVVGEVIDEQQGSAAVGVAFGVVRFLGFGLIVLLVGLAASLAWLAGGASAAVRGGLWTAVAASGLLLALDSLAWLGLEAAQAAGLGVGGAFRWSLITAVAHEPYGRAWLARTVVASLAALVALVGYRRDGRAAAGAVAMLAAAAAVTPAVAGHARTEGGLAIAADAIHVLAAGVWVGGLGSVLLALVLAGGDRWSLTRTLVPRFSSAAAYAVAAVVAAGIVSGYLQVRSWDGLLDTTYGRLVLLKAALVVVLLWLGGFNRFVSVPVLARGDATPAARAVFLRAVGGEAVVMAAVVAVTALLVAKPPARTQTVDRGGPVSVDARVGPYDVNLVVDPARTGRNVAHLYLLDHSTGQPAEVSETSVSATLPSAGIGPLRLTATTAGPGHAVLGDATFPLAGRWRVRVDVRKGDFDQWSVTVPIDIEKDQP